MGMLKTQRSEPDIDIRFAECKDLDDIFAIEHSSFDNPWKSARKILNLISDRKVLVCQSENMLVGFLMFRCTSEGILIMKTATQPDLRRKGVGAALLNFMIIFSKDKKKLYLHVRENNKGAIVFYRKNGFEEVDRLTGYYKKNSEEDAIRMELDISTQG